jgi:N-acetylmuramoyl-L-alanine amidase
LPEVATAPPPQPEPEMLSSIPEQIPPAAPPPEGQQAPASVAPPTAPQQTAESGQPAQSLVKVAETQQQQKRIARIIVDAGHGGGDPGCEVGSGVNEKDVTLAIALQMKKQIKEVTGAEVLLVRDKDAEVSLRERTNWAQSNKGDLLISVHLGASMTPSAKGVEIFCQPGGAKPHTGTSSTPAGDAYTQQSRGVAEAIGAAFSGAGVVFRGVRETPCRLLKDAPMPGIVIETGFATNAEESATLATEAVQAQIAKCAADGIMAYLGEEVTRRANASAGQAAPDGGKKP